MKSTIVSTADTVQCPVRGCTNKVKRQKYSFRKDSVFLCPQHKIYISKSTWEYEIEGENVLWHDNLLNEIKTVKRESRMARDNSEDAVTWNVFRFLEINNQIADYLSWLIDTPISSPEIKYWSYCQNERSSWSDLNKARKQFGEQIHRGTEPDLIIITEKELFFIEAKFGSGNNTTPGNVKNITFYEKGAEGWSSKVFRTDITDISVRDKKYELMRLWLLGSWLAKQLNKNFFLINLVLREREKNIKNDFSKNLMECSKRNFLRATWEDIYDFILKSDTVNVIDKQLIVDYFQNKSLGFDSKGRIIKAFSVK